MKKSTIITINILILIGLSCENDNEDNTVSPSIDCQNLKAGLLEKNKDNVKNKINTITTNLTPNASEKDPIGHRENFSILINKLNECSGINAEMLCYACIETYPAQTELLMTIDYADRKVYRVIDILTPEDDVLSFVNVHDYYNSGVNLEKTNYKGCFIENPKNKSNNVENKTDTIFYEIKDDTLTLNVILNYNCCGLLNDSITIENEQINIHISDTCSGDYCECKCMCDFEFEYKFTDFWQRNSHYYVYLNGFRDNNYELWKDIKFIDAFD